MVRAEILQASIKKASQDGPDAGAWMIILENGAVAVQAGSEELRSANPSVISALD